MLNPILFTENVVSDFLRYQLTTYAFADPHFHDQMRRLLSLEETRRTPLLKGPFVSLSQAFQQGAAISRLAEEKVLHPHLVNLTEHPHVYGHQEAAIRSIRSGRTTLVSTGTGSGKTECFLYPIISRCLELNDANAAAGITAVLVYPMNALAEDQLARLRTFLAGTGISFGMYVGKTPETEAEVVGERLPEGASRSDYLARLASAVADQETHAIYPPEERITRETMRTPGKQPRILLTNVKQLELLLTRHRDVELFDGARLEFLVFDEAHTFRGAAGAETACLIRRLRAFCGRDASQTTCIATSATLADPQRGPDAAKEFAVRFFGVEPDGVEVVTEQYEKQEWNVASTKIPPLHGEPRDHLKNILDAVEGGENAGRAIRIAYRAMTGGEIGEKHWRRQLYEQLRENPLVWHIAKALRTPRPLGELLQDLKEHAGREVCQEELLAWLALGCAARLEDRPLLRPVVHAVVRGVEGAVVTFPAGEDRPRLWLSREDVTREAEQTGAPPGYALPVANCTTCGQHYFIHHVKDLEFTNATPEGGEAIGDGVKWEPLDPGQGGKRLVLLDRTITGAAEEDEDGASLPAAMPGNCAATWLCLHCGTLHDRAFDRCGHCAALTRLVELMAVRQKEASPGKLSRCVSCGAQGRSGRAGDYREPARPVRAITVSDVHVLALTMLQHSEHRRLLVFSDNRQDAAFQAGWMQDHARRFRLRSLMFDRLREGALSVGDLTAHLDDLLEKDDELSRALATEVWKVHRKEAEGRKHQEERKYYLRIQVLRELTTAVKQRLGLEPWGRLRVVYRGLTGDLDFIRQWASKINVEPGILSDGISALLDIYRRGSILRDNEGGIYSRFWGDGEREMMYGYLTLSPGVPKGLKLRRQGNDEGNRVTQLLSDRGETMARHTAKCWGVAPEEVDEFLEGLWRLLSETLELLVPVTLLGRRGNPLPACSGTYQIDADKLRLEAHHGFHQCQKCRRLHLRPTPKDACMAWRCDGTTKPVDENPDNFDLLVLDQGFPMLRAREHSAQVPGDEREQLERDFKGNSERVNTLVCTPTLELGVDIGALDSVLMRNVPPQSANYWQRAGRAGRRHRLAVNLTYSRPASHDRAYFTKPLKLLEGRVEAPRFNLRNEVMLAKHVHATILTALHQFARERSRLPQSDREEIESALAECFPGQVRSYLFQLDGSLRDRPLTVDTFAKVVVKHGEPLLAYIQKVFSQGWPEADASVVTENRLRDNIQSAGPRLQAVIHNVWRRLQWALDQLNRLDQVRKKMGALDPEQDSLRGRCDRYVKKLKGMAKRRRSEAEGFDETNTFGVLASEGFLPGYGLDTGSVTGYAIAPRSPMGARDLDLRRPSAVALREYVPGNSIYAIGNRYYPRVFHLDPQGVHERVQLNIDIENEAVQEVGVVTNEAGLSLGTDSIRAVPMGDVDLPHQSQITDEEEFRFQLPVSVFGKEQDRHDAGTIYSWGGQAVSIRKGVHLRLVNVGPASRVRGGELGYPVCLVCGQSRSPFASQRDRDEFAKDHSDRCSHKVEATGFYSDIVADTLAIHACIDREQGYSVAEALRMAATQVLEMELDDLQLLSIGRAGSSEVDLLLYDPMPGGSGLLDQMVTRWGEITQHALDLTGGCPSGCARSCIDCLQTFRNAFYHRHLDRGTARDSIFTWGSALSVSHPIPPKHAAKSSDDHGKPGNDREKHLKEMLVRAGFGEPICNHVVDLGRPIGKTYPDFFFALPDGRKEGVCIYLDGMSDRLHGNPATASRDRELREALRNEGYEVVEIPAGNLDDPEAMRRYFYRIGLELLGRDEARSIRDDIAWYSES